ncbi:hypothetical protein H4R18_003056 [Coemansia javaensis]|uniref:BD-FAE-like domain-containing protein n=1 Tax=Coemansia javaensis TaxID=2761396 RepID=A0A9W8HD81_9FUNG|nr:hypothetical protein H4R18_003056 [Coemansia javaensis]
MATTRIADIAYLPGGSARHTLDLYLPEPPPPAAVPLAVYVHGGAWRVGDKGEFGAVAEGLIAAAPGRQLAVAAVNYELAVRHPAHVDSAAAAVRFLATDRSYPGQRAVDRARVFLVGHSAGAHLAALMTLAPGHEGIGPIRGVVGLGGLYDIPALLDEYPDYRDFVDPAFGADDRAAASPACIAAHMRDDARRTRFLVVHSTGDELVGPAQAIGFAAQLMRAGHSDVTLAARDLGGHDAAPLSAGFWQLVCSLIFTSS